MIAGPKMALEPAKLSDFKLAGALGTGTTARVYEAVHTATGRPVAIKVIEQASSTSEVRERFAREALILSGVESRHVSKILGFGFDKGQPFLVLERLQGETLDAKLRRDGPVPAPIAVRWIEQLIVGVRDCHDTKVIHRDIKPSNIYLHHDGFDEIVKLIDFGVARLREITGDTGGLTSTNHLIGSMGYMAPEQFQNAKTVGFQADLYAIGVVIFRTLTGRLPFVSRSLEAVIRMKSEQAVPAISSMAGMPQSQVLDWFVQKAMAREAEARFQSAREMLEQWWVVQSNLEELGVTDTNIGRVDESYAGRMPRRPPSAAPPTIPHSGSGAVVVGGGGGNQNNDYGDHPANDDERTIRRPPRQPIPLPSGAAGPPVPTQISAPSPQSSTSQNAMPSTQGAPITPITGSFAAESRVLSSDRTVREEAPPHTIPGSAPMGAARPYESGHEIEIETDETAHHMPAIHDDMNDDDPFDLPTRTDPNLKKLVQRELELQKARKERG